MTFKFRTYSVAAVITVVVAGYVVACRKSPISTSRTTPVSFIVPEGFPAPFYDFNSNPVTEEGLALGKKLFHDSRLAAFNDVNCGSCHQQIAAFTTFDHDLGHGTNFQHTKRNVPAIFNMIWQHSFQWDGGVPTLEDQVMTCITAAERMGETEQGILSKVDSSSEYRELFSKAFGDDQISGDRIRKAISQFVAMLVSADSKYDRVKKGTAQFNSSESAGYEIFKINCASCHAEPLFTDGTYRNNGLPHRDFHEDAGRMQITGDPADSLKFKVPTLRNIGLTSYYGHDGRYAGISEVLDHYTSTITPGPTLDPLLQNNLTLTNLEKFYLQEFLLSLTDSTLVNNSKFR